MAHRHLILDSRLRHLISILYCGHMIYSFQMNVIVHPVPYRFIGKMRMGREARAECQGSIQAMGVESGRVTVSQTKTSSLKCRGTGWGFRMGMLHRPGVTLSPLGQGSGYVLVAHAPPVLRPAWLSLLTCQQAINKGYNVWECQRYDPVYRVNPIPCMAL